MLSHRLEGVKGQCALLAGYGIQGEVLANVLYRSSSLIMAPRVNVALRLKYLFGELGCTPEVSQCCSICSKCALSVHACPGTGKEPLAWELQSVLEKFCRGSDASRKLGGICYLRARPLLPS